MNPHTKSFTDRLDQNQPVSLAMFLHEVAYLGADQPEYFLDAQAPPRRPLSESQIQWVAALPGFPSVSCLGRVKPEAALLYMQTVPSLVAAAVRGPLPFNNHLAPKRRKPSKQFMDALAQPSDILGVKLSEFIHQFFRPTRRLKKAAIQKISALSGCPTFDTPSLGTCIPIRKGWKWASENLKEIQAILDGAGS